MGLAKEIIALSSKSSRSKQEYLDKNQCTQNLGSIWKHSPIPDCACIAFECNVSYGLSSVFNIQLFFKSYFVLVFSFLSSPNPRFYFYPWLFLLRSVNWLLPLLPLLEGSMYLSVVILWMLGTAERSIITTKCQCNWMHFQRSVCVCTHNFLNF